MNDNGAITGMDAREDGVYITYVPADGADPVSKNWVAMALLTWEICHTLARRIMVIAHCLLFATKKPQLKMLQLKI